MPTIEYQEIAPGIRRATAVPTAQEAEAQALRASTLGKARAPIVLPPGAPPWANEIIDKLDAILALLQSG